MGYRSRHNQSGAPNWFIFLLGIALIFSIYYLWNSLRDYLRTGGLSVAQATQMALVERTATQERRILLETELPTARPTSTERPPCREFEVVVNSGIMRQAASTASNYLQTLERGAQVCVLASEEAGDGYIWYLIDRDPITRRIEIGYMREDLIRSLNPTPTASNTPLPFPSVTAMPSQTPDNAPDRLTINTPRPARTLTNTPTTPSLTPTASPTPTAPGVEL